MGVAGTLTLSSDQKFDPRTGTWSEEFEAKLSDNLQFYAVAYLFTWDINDSHGRKLGLDQMLGCLYESIISLCNDSTWSKEWPIYTASGFKHGPMRASTIVGVLTASLAVTALDFEPPNIAFTAGAETYVINDSSVGIVV